MSEGRALLGIHILFDCTFVAIIYPIAILLVLFTQCILPVNTDGCGSKSVPVGAGAIKAALANPVKSLRTE